MQVQVQVPEQDELQGDLRQLLQGQNHSPNHSGRLPGSRLGREEYARIWHLPNPDHTFHPLWSALSLGQP